jgi:serpin B
MKRNLAFFVLLVPLLAGAAPVDTSDVVSAINALGLDLYRIQPGDGNLLLSPYSIQDALAMTYAGAAGDTRAEMQRVLHYPADDTALHGGFAELARELAQIQQDSAKAVAAGGGGKNHGPTTPIKLDVANQLFAQKGYGFRAPFLALVKDNYGAPLAQLDFANDPEKARSTINDWVHERTEGKINDLIPSGGITKGTRLTLANAIYLHAGWDNPFDKSSTQLSEFFIHGSESAMVPMMYQGAPHGYVHGDGYTAVSLPYAGGGLQFLILLPDERNGLAALEGKVTPALLAGCANLSPTEIDLFMPKFKLPPATLALADDLQKLGLKAAFDKPQGSANFDRMAPRTPKDYLCIGKVFHQAYLSLDEDSTEAAAATAVIVEEGDGAAAPPERIEVRVDHPFIFAIQHVPSGECLFLGRVEDPR